MANGGTVLDSGGNVQNRDWQIYVSLVEQYAEHFQDSDTYSLTLTADSRFVRSFTTNGPGAWKRIEDGTDGWVDLVTNVKAHHSSRTTVVRHGITGGFDATYFNEIELELTACGRWPAANLGMNGIVRFRRQGSYWTSGATTENNTALNTPGHGSFKVHLDDEIGFSGLLDEGDTFLEFASSTEALPTNPNRRYSMLIHLLGPDGTTNADRSNDIRQVAPGPFSSINSYTRLTVRMR